MTQPVLTLDALRAFFRRSPFMVELGIEPVECGEGRVVTQMAIAGRHLQHTGQVHAGVAGAMADHTMGAAAQTLAADGQWAITAEFKTSLLRAARGQRLECVGVVLKPGRRLMFTEAEVYAVDGEARALVAKSSATMAMVQG
jgi:uncharacterized protein (TIGR00369 family)